MQAEVPDTVTASPAAIANFHPAVPLPAAATAAAHAMDIVAVDTAAADDGQAADQAQLLTAAVGAGDSAVLVAVQAAVQPYAEEHLQLMRR